MLSVSLYGYINAHSLVQLWLKMALKSWLSESSLTKVTCLKKRGEQ